MSSQLVSLVEDHQVPTSLQQLALGRPWLFALAGAANFIPGNLIQPDDQIVYVFKGVSGRCRGV